MLEKLIIKYIDKITREDIINFANQNNATLNKDEVELIYYHTKKNWREIIYGNPEPIFNDLKNQLSSNNYEKAIELFNEFKQKYKYYL